MGRIVVVGAGVAGLGAAMLLAGDAHDVIVLERGQTREQLLALVSAQ